MEDKVFEIVLEKDEVTWQTMLYDLIKKEGMDPWDVNVSVISKRYMDMLKKLKEMDFRISGKMVLAAAILLKLKSNKLIGEDIDELDRLMAGDEDEYDSFYEDLEGEYAKKRVQEDGAPLMPRTPQPRKRKVSVYDLMASLNRALEVRDRRVMRSIPSVKIDIPKKKVDVTALIGDVYGRAKDMLSNNQKLTFSQLIPSDTKEDKVYTFIPLLHLAHHDQRKLDLWQEKPFEEIEITLNKGA
ncbi:MAG: segregation/condensation protein A [bacterium]|nr:segregation/condensation protein A [bacterium]